MVYCNLLLNSKAHKTMNSHATFYTSEVISWLTICQVNREGFEINNSLCCCMYFGAFFPLQLAYFPQYKRKLQREREFVTNNKQWSKGGFQKPVRPFFLPSTSVLSELSSHTFVLICIFLCLLVAKKNVKHERPKMCVTQTHME